MKTFQIKGTARLAVGKKSNKALRVQDLVPCVIYGGDKVVHFQAHENEFRKLIYTPKVYQTLIDVDGTVYNAFMQALQFHPATDKLLHIDFLEIRENVPVNLHVPGIEILNAKTVPVATVVVTRAARAAMADTSAAAAGGKKK